MGTHWKKAYSSEHLGAVDLDGKAVTVAIATVEPAKVKTESGEEQGKWEVGFKGAGKKWLVPVTQAACLGAMFGDFVEGWVGKRVTLRAERVDAFGEQVEAVRLVGSPDITEPVRLRVRMGRKRVTLAMQPTGAVQS